MEPKINKLTHYCIRVIHHFSMVGRNNIGYKNYRAYIILKIKIKSFFRLINFQYRNF